MIAKVTSLQLQPVSDEDYGEACAKSERRFVVLGHIADVNGALYFVQDEPARPNRPPRSPLPNDPA